MNTFEFIQQNFARYVLPELSENPVRDTVKALTMNHMVISKQNRLSPSRLTGWAIIRSRGTVLQANLETTGEGLVSGDQRTRYEAWADALVHFNGPVCLLEFTKAVFNISNIYLTHDVRMTRVCSPDGAETFNFAQVPEKHAGKAHRKIYEWTQKNAA
tara:strand:- start:217 stop:690 length:474 start_codon:yes stop_codon:yes gene_type:complete